MVFRRVLLFLFIISGLAFGAVAQRTIPGDAVYATGKWDKDEGATVIYFKSEGNEAAKMDWSIFLDSAGRVVKARVEGRQVAELWVDGEQVAPANYGQYQGAVKQLFDKLDAEEEIEKLEARIDARSDEIDGYADEIDRIADRIDSVAEKLDNLGERTGADLTRERSQLSQTRSQLSEGRSQISARRSELSGEREKLSAQRESLNNMTKIGSVIQKIASDLRAEGLLRDRGSKFSFKLSNRELIINGKRQPAAIHEKMKRKYIVETSGESGFLYRWKEDI